MNWTILTLAFAVTIGLAAAWSFEERFQIAKTICTRDELKPSDGVICNILFSDQGFSPDAGTSI